MVHEKYGGPGLSRIDWAILQEGLSEGAFDIDGKLPVNTDGGLKSGGHPLVAAASAQIIEIDMQLREEAGARQVRDAKFGLAHAMGAGPNSSIVILKR